jgi:hypothetical protein
MITQDYDSACVTLSLTADDLGTTDSRTPAMASIKLDFDSLGDEDADLLDDIDVQVTVFDVNTTSEELGDTHVFLSQVTTGLSGLTGAGTSVLHPVREQRSFGKFEEIVNNIPGVLELPVMASVDAYIEATVTAYTINRPHTDTAIRLEGMISGAPAIAGDKLSMVNGAPVPLLNAFEGPIILNGRIDDVELELNPTSCDPLP